MTREMAADHPSVPRPVVVRVRCRMNRNHAAAISNELLQCGAPVSDEPFGGGVLGIGRAAEQDDCTKALQAGIGKDRRVLARYDAKAALSSQSADRFDSGRNGIVPVPSRSRINEDRFGCGVGRCRCGASKQDQQEQEPTVHEPKRRRDLQPPEVRCPRRSYGRSSKPCWHHRSIAARNPPQLEGGLQDDRAFEA